MTLQQLHQVITIAESRSMNEASRKLFVSQPNLSAVVRELEEEAGITIFIRSNRGIVLTPEGEEFIGYAKQVVEQYHLLESRYISSASKKKFSVSMQHYTFAVKAFVEVVKAVGMEEYEFAVHETQTNQVIENVRNMKSELGILFLSKFNEAVLQKLFRENDVIFEELFTCDTYVYLWKGHPLAQRDVISMKELQEYPCLVFEQGKNNSFYFAEEMKSTYEYKKMIHADDRALTVISICSPRQILDIIANCKYHLICDKPLFNQFQHQSLCHFLYNHTCFLTCIRALQHLPRTNAITLRAVRLNLCDRTRFIAPCMVDQQLCIHPEKLIQQIFVIVIIFSAQ